MSEEEGIIQTVRAGFSMESFRFTEIELSAFDPVKPEDKLTFFCEHFFEESEDDASLWLCTVDFAAYFQDDPSSDGKAFDPEDYDDPYYVEAVAEGVFRLTSDIENGSVEWAAIMKTRAPALVYSQMRPLLRLMMQDSGYPQFILPLLDFTSTDVTDELDAE